VEYSKIESAIYNTVKAEEGKKVADKEQKVSNSIRTWVLLKIRERKEEIRIEPQLVLTRSENKVN